MKSKRLLSLLLALVMILGALPTTIFAANDEPTKAAEQTITVIAGSDFQAHESGDDESNTGTARSLVVKKIYNELITGGIKPYGAIFCGDYSQYQAAADTQRGIQQLRTLTTNAFGNLSDWVFVQGNHDRQANPGGSEGLSKAGANDTPYYGVWVLHNEDYGWTDSGNMAGDEATIRAEVAEMKAYFDAKIKEGYTKPIFVAAHTPLHYSYRTRTYEDARYARIVFNVLNEAGAAGLNIIYLFGHNHSAPSDSYIGGGAAYLGRGESIFLAKTYNVNAQPAMMTLNFTYMNAGYLSYAANQNSNGSTPTAAVFEITGDQVEIRRYCYYGMLDLKLPGTFATIDGVTEKHETYGATEATMNSYLATRYKSTTIGPPTQANVGDRVEMPVYGTRYYQVNSFMEGQFYVLANYGDATATGKQILRGISQGNVLSVNVNIKKDDRGYYLQVPSGTVANEIQWVWEDYAASENGTVGSLKNRQSGRYLQMTDSSANYFDLTGNKGLTTTKYRPTDPDYKMFWGYDNKIRTQGDHVGKPSGLYAHSHNELQVLANRYYVLRNTNDNGWVARGNTGPNGGCGPTYIYKRFTDVQVGTEYVWAEGYNDYYLVTGEYGSWEKVRLEILRDLVVKVQDRNGNVSPVTDFTLTSTFDPSKPGEYLAHVVYNGYTVATIKIHVADAASAFESATVIPDMGTVYQNALHSVPVGSVLRLSFSNGAEVDVPITVGMLRDADGNPVSTAELGTLENLTVAYASSIQIPGFTLRVVDKNYPPYPEAGSTRVDKVGHGVDFQNTGAAQIELSATGLPKVEGIDVIVMVDTSSSMGVNDGIVDADGRAISRLERTHIAVNDLIDTLKESVSAGLIADVQIAIADFNDYKIVTSESQYTDEPWGYYALDGNNYVHGSNNTTGLPYDSKSWTTHGARTGVDDPTDLSARAFVDVMTLNNNGQKWACNTTLDKQSGTNYDFAFDAIYQLGYNIKMRNEEQGKGNRDLIVLFMSDGTPFQFNYFQANSDDPDWNHWLSGTLNDAGLNNLVGDTRKQYFYNPNGLHWMAEAIKGDPNTRYKVIRKSTTGLEDVIRVSGSGQWYEYTLPGLGANMYTIGLSLGDRDDVSNINNTNKIYNKTTIELMERIASTPSQYYAAVNQDELHKAFHSFIGDMMDGATQAYYIDTMGERYDLYMSNDIDKIASDGSITTVSGVVPKIEVLQYNLVNGVRVGDPVVCETIVFHDDYRFVPDGTTIYATSTASGQSTTISCKKGELLRGKYVWYNTSTTESHLYDRDGDTNVIEIGPESFYYYIGTMEANVEYVLSYYVYLTDALDDNNDGVSVENGIYDTNLSAILYYKNYLGEDCYKTTITPQFPWGPAQMGYGFYLVDEDGRPLAYNGEVTTFTDSVKVTDPFYLEILRDAVGNHISGEEKLDEHLSMFFELFDPVSGASVTANTDGSGHWEIDSSSGLPETTYVTNYGGPPTTNDSSELGTIPNYDCTVFWFAVKIKTFTYPDTVVVDFGLSIDGHVIANDIFGDRGTLIGIAKMPVDLTTTDKLRSDFTSSLKGSYGDARIEGNKVVYTPKDMQMDNVETLAYAVKYTDGTSVRYFYDTFTVVPATSIYYEDDFVEFTGTWNTAGEYQGDNQGEDRPGEFEFPDYDTDNIYGYDPAYDNSTTYSLGSARYAHVTSKTFEDDGAWPTAKFTFTGTGFDLISLTSNQTGFITCRVYQGKQTDTILESWVVDTYYGYERAVDEDYPWVKYTYTYHADEDCWTASKIAVKDKLNDETTVLPTDYKDGEQVIQYRVNYIWTATDGENDLYQIPVIKSPENPKLPYGTYTVVVTPTYIPFFDHTGAGGYDFYLDAIRIYSPAQNMEDYYVQDGEAWPQYVELRQQLLSVDASGNATGYVNGISFIDGVAANGEIADYEAYGPNNEIYLNSNQAVAFAIDSKGEKIANVHVGMKIFDGAGTLNVSSVDATGKTLADWDISSASHTDLYYSITEAYVPVSGNNVSNVIVLTNTGSKPITLTTLKITYEQQPTEDSQLVMNLENMQAASKHVTRKIAPLVVETPVDEALVFTRHSLSLQSSIAMHYQVENSILEGYDYCYVEFERYDYGTGALVTESAEAEAYEGVMLFAYLLDSYQMTDLVSATLYGVKDGVTYKGETLENSIEQYILSRLPQTSDAKLLRLYADLLTYGAMAQVHMDYRTDVLANASLGEYAAYVTADDPTADNYSAETAYGYSGAVLKQMALGIASEIQLQTIITLDGYKAEEVYGVMTLERDGQTVTQRVEGTDFETVNGYYVIIFDTLTAIDGRTPVEVTVYNAEGQPISETWTYSISTYYSIRNTGVPGQTMRALLNYLDAAEAYFGQ